jgi:hypothetical protein
MKTMLYKCAAVIAALLLILSSCNPVKKVLRSPEKTLQVVDFYLQKYPLISDTAFIRLPGDTLITSTTDTLLDIKNDTLIRDTTYYITKTFTKYRVDTLVRTIVDRKLQTELQNQNMRLKIQNEELEKRLSDEKKKAKSWFWWFVGACAVIAAYLGVKGYKLFKPSININNATK